MALRTEVHRVSADDFLAGQVSNMGCEMGGPGHRFERVWQVSFDRAYKDPPHVQIIPISVRSWDYHITNLQVSRTGCRITCTSWEHKFPCLGFDVTVFSSEDLEQRLSEQHQENEKLYDTLINLTEICKDLKKRLETLENKP